MIGTTTYAARPFDGVNRDTPDWTAALCRQADPDLWFPERGHEEDAQKAKAICRRCPIALECLSYAVADPSIMGVWGGTTDDERRAMRARRRAAA